MYIVNRKDSAEEEREKIFWDRGRLGSVLGNEGIVCRGDFEVVIAGVQVTKPPLQARGLR